MQKFAVAVILSVFPVFGDLTLNTTAVDPNLFRVTTFVANLPRANAVALASDGSFLVAHSQTWSAGTITRFTDNNGDGFADGPGTIVYSTGSGPITQLKQAGPYYLVGEFGSRTIRMLSPGASPADPMTIVGDLQFTFPVDWYHPTLGMAVRATPGSPGSYDLVFNVGSQFNAQSSVDPVTVSGFQMGPLQLSGDALYMITIDTTGATPVASNLRTVATGIRNVYGMAFHPETGDFYSADNAIDEEPNTPTSLPPQAEELNRIAAHLVGSAAFDFGYPNCYIAFDTGIEVGNCAGVQMPVAVFQPIPNPPAAGRSEGPTEIAFAPAAFPAGWNNGIFTGFSGKSSGVNDENAVAFYDFATGQVSHFVESGLPGVGNLVGVMATNDSLFISDWGTGNIYQITSTIPEPGSGLMVGIPILLALWRRFR
jgi:hypothetical protein